MNAAATVTPIEMAAGERNIEQLREALRKMQQGGVAFTEISKQTEVNRTTISQLVNQNVAPRTEYVEALWAFVDRCRQAETVIFGERRTNYKQCIELYSTAEFQEALGWCKYIRDKRKMGVLIGYAGSGKTTILRQFIANAPGAVYIEAFPNMRVNDLINTIARETGVTVNGNAYTRMQALFKALKDRDDVMLIIDEAEYLRKWDVDKFEYLRKLWDNTGTPIVFAGTPELETMLTRGSGRENLAQLYRRKYELKLTGIREKETLHILLDYHVSQEAAQMLAKVAADTKHGGMGNFVEILDLCLEAANGGEIDAPTVQSAKQYKLLY